MPKNTIPCARSNVDTQGRTIIPITIREHLNLLNKKFKLDYFFTEETDEFIIKIKRRDA